MTDKQRAAELLSTARIEAQDPLVTAVAQLNRQHRRQVDKHIRETLGLKFRSTIQVSIRRPRWMPERMWRWMWRQVILAETPLEQVPE